MSSVSAIIQVRNGMVEHEDVCERSSGRSGCAVSQEVAQNVEEQITHNEVSDVELMAMVGQGDQAAYRLLVERHFERIYALAYRMIYHGADAEDIAQDTFLKLWLKRQDWKREGAAITTWLYRVTVNACIDYKRKPRAVTMPEGYDPADVQPTAVTLIHRQQTNLALRQAMLKLSVQQQTALALFYHQGLSNAEAAEVLDISVNAMESLLKRARKKLRLYLHNSSEDLIEAIQE